MKTFKEWLNEDGTPPIYRMQGAVPGGNLSRNILTGTGAIQKELQKLDIGQQMPWYKRTFGGLNNPLARQVDTSNSALTSGLTQVVNAAKNTNPQAMQDIKQKFQFNILPSVNRIINAVNTNPQLTQNQPQIPTTFNNILKRLNAMNSLIQNSAYQNQNQNYAQPSQYTTQTQQAL